MLKENNYYEQGFPIDINIVKIEEYPLHYHHDIEFVLVLKGSIQLSCGYCTYTVSKNEIFTINGHEVHGLYKHGEVDNIVALIGIDHYYFSKTFSEISKSCFRTNTKEVDDMRTSILRNLLLQLLLTHLQKAPEYKHKNILKMEEVLKVLYANFHYFSMEQNQVINCRNDDEIFVNRVNNITHYIYENYSKKLTLEELAKREYLSTFYLSHIIKKGTGMNFREFLCFVRVEASQRFVLGTNKKINVIAAEVGFSTTAYYIKYFKKWFGLTPEEYRMKFLYNTQGRYTPSNLKNVKSDEVLQIIKKEISLLTTERMRLQSPIFLKLQFTIDAAKEKLYDFYKELIFKCSKRQFFDHEVEIRHYCKILQIEKLFVCYNNSADNLLHEICKEKKDFFSPTKIEASFSTLHGKNRIEKFGNDSIVVLPFILKRAFLPSNEFHHINCLADSPHENHCFCGDEGILTSDFIPKPSFYAYQIINIMKGELIDWSKYHAITRSINERGKKQFHILVLNQDDDLDALCLKPSSLSETIETIESYQKTIDLTIKLANITGLYLVSKMKFDQSNMFLSHMNQIKNKSLSPLNPALARCLINSVGCPRVELYQDAIEKEALFNITLSEVEVQLITLSEI